MIFVKQTSVFIHIKWVIILWYDNLILLTLSLSKLSCDMLWSYNLSLLKYWFWLLNNSFFSWSPHFVWLLGELILNRFVFLRILAVRGFQKLWHFLFDDFSCSYWWTKEFSRLSNLLLWSNSCNLIKILGLQIFLEWRFGRGWIKLLNRLWLISSWLFYLLINELMWWHKSCVFRLWVLMTQFWDLWNARYFGLSWCTFHLQIN